MTEQYERSASTDRCGFEFDPADGDGRLDGPWSCSAASRGESDRCIFHMTAEERAAAGVDDEAVTEAFAECLRRGGEAKHLVGATLPRLDLSYLDVETADQSPIDLRHATIEEGIDARFARFEEPVDLRGATVGGLDAENAEFQKGLLCTGATFDGAVDLEEATLTGDDADFADAEFRGPVEFEAAVFGDDVNFDGATFLDAASFRGARFHGRANGIDENTSFDGARFVGEARFDYARFEATTLREVTFERPAVFENARVGGPVTFEGAQFESVADLDEMQFGDDACFEGARFRDEAHFRGVEFEGGANVLREDASFRNVEFGGDARFEHGRFGDVAYESVRFAGEAEFRDAQFDGGAEFSDARFEGDADFDEAEFEGDADFGDATFAALANFRGAEFRGNRNHLGDSVSADGATFEGDANFHDVEILTGSFWGVEFGGDVNFTDAVATDGFECKIESIGAETVADFTGARIEEGAIEQPADGWVRYDFTEATVGEVSLRASTAEQERELLDYVRFCDTTFDGFDFSDHTTYLDRNDWALHTFDDAAGNCQFATPTTPETVEKTYLRAKNAASAESNVKAAGEFRVKRQKYAREKFAGIARDADEDARTRVRNGLRAAENYFLGISCGYGMRLYRIAAVFALWPLFPALLYAFGGKPFETGAGQVDSPAAATTAEGLSVLYQNLQFSYITFLTIGYGNTVPEGWLAGLLAGAEVYASIVLGGLFIYALVKRSEV